VFFFQKRGTCYKKGEEKEGGGGGEQMLTVGGGGKERPRKKALIGATWGVFQKGGGEAKKRECFCEGRELEKKKKALSPGWKQHRIYEKPRKERIRGEPSFGKRGRGRRGL